METSTVSTQLTKTVHEFVLRGFTPQFAKPARTFPTNPLWRRLRQLGTQLWLDTGDLEESGALWTSEFSALTTNNTLLNREVQKGLYDDLIVESADMLAEFADLSPRRRTLEIAFILNAVHGLKLVEAFDAHVSVEEHTDLAHDVDAAVDYAHRYHAICPRRFIVKIPFTPAGLLATRKLTAQGVPVNHTLGFSARENFLITRIGEPAYVNVFMGRLGSFVADNQLGSGENVGERATIASQAAIRQLRKSKALATAQIGASIRNQSQVLALAGLDVMTIPTKAASALVAAEPSIAELRDRMHEDYHTTLNAGVNEAEVRLDTLWDIDRPLVEAIDALNHESLDTFSPDDLVGFFADHGSNDVLVKWTDQQIATSAAEGKIPVLDNWRDALAERAIGLDSLMTLAGLNSFAADQKAMDERIEDVLQRRDSGRNRE